MNFRWRPARAADHATIVALCVRFYADDPGQKPVRPLDVRRTLRAFARQPLRGCAFVAERAGAVVGYAFLCSFWSNELHGEVCTLDELFVERAHRGRGIGTSLMKQMLRRTLPVFRRAVAFELEVSAKNMRARALYARHGFERRKNETLRRLA